MAEGDVSKHEVTRKLDAKAVDERLVELHGVDKQLLDLNSEKTRFNRASRDMEGEELQETAGEHFENVEGGLNKRGLTAVDGGKGKGKGKGAKS